MLVAYLIAIYFVINNTDDFENHLKKLREQHHYTQNEVVEYLNI